MPVRRYATEEERHAAQVVQHRAAAQRARDRVRAARVAAGERVYRSKTDQERSAARTRRQAVSAGLLAFSVAAAHARLDAQAARAAAVALAEKDAASEDNVKGPLRYGSSKVRMPGSSTLRSATLTVPSLDPLGSLWSPGTVEHKPMPSGSYIAHGKRQARKDGSFSFTLESVHRARWAAERASAPTDEETEAVDE